MKALPALPNLVEQVHAAILDGLTSGQIAPGDRLVQAPLAQALGVSRQPVQQALTLLLEQGVLHAAPGRRLFVAPLDVDHVRHMYDLRAVIEGLACRRAAERSAKRAAELAPALAPYLSCTQRVMGEVLTRDETPHDIWIQHAEILDAIIAGAGDRAEALVQAHLTQAAAFMVARLGGPRG